MLSDIFISYASEDRDRVKSLAQALERKSWSVWWDRRIPEGRPFDEVIEEALNTARSVVVVWTKTSVQSTGVKNEARKGLCRGVLLQVMLRDKVDIPLEFAHLPVARLMDWQPGRDHAGFDQFIEDLAGVIGVPSSPAVQRPLVMRREEPVLPMDIVADPELPPAQADENRPRESTRPVQSKQSPPYLLIGIGLLVVVGSFAGQWILSPIPRPISEHPPSFPIPLTTTPSARKELTPAPASTVKPEAAETQTATAALPSPAGPAETITGSDGAPMVLIPAGEFWRGSPEGEGHDDEHPRRRVALSAFYLDKYEVTVARYAEFVRARNRAKPDHWDQMDGGKHGNLPVMGVDWHEAKAYCEWAGKRLPTEAEWEKAARGTDGRPYPWGHAEPTARLANFGKAYTTTASDDRLTPVDWYEAGRSPYGLHQMAGNVREWTADWYDERYYEKGPLRDPKGPSSGQYRVVRGGAWDDAPDDVRSARRRWDTPTGRRDAVGFRCARDAAN